MRTIEIKYQIYEIKKWEEKTQREDLKYETKYYTYEFQHYQTISSFRESIYTGKMNIDEAGIDHSN